MFTPIIVPVDGSPESWRAFDTALALASRTSSDIHVVEVCADPLDGRLAKKQLDHELRERAPLEVEVTCEVQLSVDLPGRALADYVAARAGSTVVMSSHGKGRTAALVGSVANDVMRMTEQSIVVVGPSVEPVNVSGPVLVAVDGSAESEQILTVAAQWARLLDATPWIVHVSHPDVALPDDNVDSAYPARLARELSASSGQRVEFEELHDRDVAEAITMEAQRQGASLIVAASHGRTGLPRLLAGSNTADMVRHATCPVLMARA